MKTIKKSDFINQQWKNGKGTTLEIFKKSLSSNPNCDFDFRLSMATVNDEGTFSNYNGFKRVILLHRGPGFKLINNTTKENIICSNQNSLYSFDGNDHVNYQSFSGECQDFNIFWRPNLIDVIVTKQMREMNFEKINYLFIFDHTQETLSDLSAELDLGQIKETDNHNSVNHITCIGVRIL